MGSNNARNRNVIGLWFFFIFEHSITFCRGCLAGKMPASNILYNLWVQEDERRARIANAVEKKEIWMQQRLNLWLQGERPAPKPLNHEDLLIHWGHHSSIWMNLLRLSFDNLHHSRRPKQTFAKYASLVYEPGYLVPPSSRFFFNSGPKTALFSHWM